MKKRITFILLITILMCSACTNNIPKNEKGLLQRQNTDLENISDEYIDDTISTDTESGDVTNVPSWATGTQMEGEIFQNLNLDGIGDADDEVYVSIYKFGDYEDKVTVLSIHLGTGETIAQVFPVYGYYSLLTGKLFSEDKDAVILEVQDSTSNYGAATVFVLDVTPIGVDPIPTVTVKLDTMNSLLLADGNVIENSVLENRVTGGTEVVNISDMPHQGLLIYFIGEKEQYQELQRNFYWTDSGWAVIPDENSN